jgi:hypothetical protein
MARLRQLYAGQYTSSGNIGAEFEALVRYLNSAEVGNKTLAELLQQLFDENGNFDGPIEFRYDATTGLQYRIGDYADPEAAWILLVDAEDLRGTPGLAVGTIGAPIFQSRADYIPTSGQTNFDYAHALSDDILCYKNGLLLRPTFDYTTNATGGTGGTGVVTLTAPALTSDRITIFKVRANDVTGYSRSDTLTATSQSVFPFIQPEGASLIVYRNGILQREGAGNDYIANPGSNTITFLTAVPSGTLVSILNIQNTAKTAVSGLMMEDQYTDLTTGLIRFDRLSIASNAIPAAKVAGLSTLITEAARISSGALAPSSPTVGRLWLDTTPSPAQLKVWDGLQWLRTSPQTAVPSFSASNALQFIRVNGTGTALEYGAPDVSGLIPLTQRGAANGVATLDSSARLPVSQLPQNISRRTLSLVRAGALANGTYSIQRIFREAITIDAISVRLNAGTCSVQLAINGVATGPTLSASTSAVEIRFGLSGNTDTPIAVDATSTSRVIGVIVTSATGSTDLDIAVGCSVTLS